MLTEELAEQMRTTAQAARAGGQRVSINSGLPYVAIDGGVDDYFFQGEEAEELLAEASHAAAEYSVTRAEYILWSAQGW